MSRSVILVGLVVMACRVQYVRPAQSEDEHIAHMAPADLRSPSMSGSASVQGQGVAGLPPSNMTAAERLRASPRHAEWVKIAALCETHYIGMIPHFTGPDAVAALVHVLGAFPGFALVEVCGYGPRLPSYLSAGCAFRQGKLQPVDRPGLGVEFDSAGAERVLEVTERQVPLPLFRRPDGSLTNW